MILADVQRAASRGDLHHRIHGMILAEYVVQVALAQVAIIDARRYA